MLVHEDLESSYRISKSNRKHKKSTIQNSNTEEINYYETIFNENDQAMADTDALS